MTTTNAVEYRGVGKRYGAAVALRGIDLDVAAGTVHALVGENGAGKSTALGLLAGRVAPTEGAITVLGEPLDVGDPRAARRAGVTAIYQELTMAPALSAKANVFLGQELSSGGVMREGDMRRAFLELCDRWKVQLDPDARTSSLSVADQQLIEVLRALVAQPRVVLFDEPTASLAEHERAVIHAIIRELRAGGTTVLFVSHNLDEVLELSDQVTVFREGRLVASRPAAEWTKPRLIEAMLGRPLAEHLAAAEAGAQAGPGDVLLRVRDLVVGSHLGPLSFDLRRGEVLGIGGLVGSGRTTLLRALAGAEPTASGTLAVGEDESSWPTTVRRSRALGVALVPEDRKAQGLLPALTARENILLSDFGGVARRGVMSRSEMQEAAAASARRVGFDVARLDAPASALSGGNQQKLLLARWQYCRPRVLLADEPTRGVDIGAKEEIMHALKEMAAECSSVIVVSSELEEVTAMSDRVLVLRGGQLAGELGGGATVDQILNLAFAAGEVAA
jgi:ABC-type sugar transport system ATPase subunit